MTPLSCGQPLYKGQLSRFQIKSTSGLYTPHLLLKDKNKLPKGIHLRDFPLLQTLLPLPTEGPPCLSHTVY